MDCETCNDLLLDLLYDELDDARAVEVRAHIETCDPCRAANDRMGRTRALSAKLALPESPTHSAAVIAALASPSVLAAAVSGRVSAVIPIERARETKAAGWLQRVGELAMRRQVAMVAISLLMVGLGLRYLPFRSPTQSVTTEMSPPEVIPATELTPTAGPSPLPASAPNTAASMRARAPAPRGAAAAEGRVATRAQNLDLLRGAPNVATADGYGSGRAGRRANLGAPTTAHRSAETESPIQVAPNSATGAIAPSNNVFAQVPVDEERQLQQAMPPSPAAAQSSWSVARNSAESASSRGDLAATIASYQRALALDPPPAERQAIALSLHRALVSAGRSDEANRVRAQYLTQAADVGALAGQVPTSLPRSQTSAATVQPSSPRPASTRPARRSNSNVNNDFNQSAY